MMEEYLNKIINADCIDILRQLPDKCIDLVLTDPPYGLPKDSSNGRGKLKNRIFNSGNIAEKWDVAPSLDIFAEIFRVSKEQIIWGGNYFNMPPCRGFIVWDKCQPWDNFSKAEYAWTSFSKPANLFRYDTRSNSDKIHPTQKPLPLFQWCLQNYSKDGDLILDCFSGSGTTAVACHNLHRRFICIEKDYDYWAASVDRLEKAQMQQFLF